MTRLGDAASYDSVERETKMLAGTAVVVATPAALYRLKHDTVRPIDRADAAALRARFNLDPEGSGKL